MKRFIEFSLAYLLLSLTNDAHALEPSYLEDGHKDTTVLIARMAGWEPEEALKLGFYSQAPDKSFKYDAVSVAFWGILYPPYRQRIMSVLHSLHGGNQEAVRIRRERLLTKISNFNYEDTENYWKLGFMIHAAGDAYAHTYTSDGEDFAYGSFVGHAFAPKCEKGKTPDVILANPDKYNKYIYELWVALKNIKRTKNSDELIKKYQNFIYLESQKELSCDTEYNEDILKIIKGNSIFTELSSVSIPEALMEEVKQRHDEWNSTFDIWRVNAFLADLCEYLNAPTNNSKR